MFTPKRLFSFDHWQELGAAGRRRSESAGIERDRGERVRGHAVNFAGRALDGEHGDAGGELPATRCETRLEWEGESACSRFRGLRYRGYALENAETDAHRKYNTASDWRKDVSSKQNDLAPGHAWQSCAEHATSGRTLTIAGEAVQHGAIGLLDLVSTKAEETSGDAENRDSRWHWRRSVCSRRRRIRRDWLA